MNKVSAAQIAEVMSDAASTLRSQQTYIGELEEKNASYELRSRVEKLAGVMHGKGMDLDTPVDALIDRLEKAAEAGKLDVFEAAVHISGPDMGSKLASLTTETPGARSATASDFENYLVGGVG